MDLVGQINHFTDGPRHIPEQPEQPEPPQDQKFEEPPIAPSDLTDEQLRALKRAKWMASEGRFSKAAQAIQQAADGRSGVREPTPDVIQKLHELHPGPGLDPPSCPLLAPSGLPMVNGKLLRAGNRIANGSAPDVFGWTANWFAPFCTTASAAHTSPSWLKLSEMVQFAKKHVIGFS